MKHLLALMALFVAFAAGAQTWNPDADFDNVIGVNDLMALLSVFGSEWTADYPQDPEYDLAAYHAGSIDYFECVRTCTNNHAQIIGLHEYAMFQDSVESYTGAPDGGVGFWLKDDVGSIIGSYSFHGDRFYITNMTNMSYARLWGQSLVSAPDLYR